MKYKILSHTADLRLEIFGKTLEELFENAAEAIADILASSVRRQVSGKFKEKIKVESANLNALLVDFLNEILAKSQINKAVYRVKNINLWIPETHKLEAELVGYKVPEFEEDIKAVTYHEVDIKKEDNVWQTKLVLDI